jgi:hypothetical protein
MTGSRKAAAFSAFAITAIALVLVVDRGGLIAWSTALLGTALFLKICLRPSRFDLAMSFGAAALPILAAISTFYYVISTWETGEVVELAIETATGTHTARVWVLDIDVHPVIYYDAPTEAANSLLAGKPLQFTRGTMTSIRIPVATQADELPQEEANRVFEAMARKYAERVDAADIYYLLLGRSRDRLAVVATLTEQ